MKNFKKTSLLVISMFLLLFTVSCEEIDICPDDDYCFFVWDDVGLESDTLVVEEQNSN